jgi:membrane protein implicated in regulation of membrane protease activity
LTACITYVRFPEVVDVNGAWTITGSHLALTGQLLRRHGLMLVTILLGAKLLEALLMRLAVELGMIHRFAGLVAVIMVILLQLVVFVGMFIVLRDGASASRLHRAHTSASPSPENANSSPIFASALLAVLIPFYGYYAGWGFLGNTLRDYSRGFLSAQWDRIDFMRPESIGPSALEVDGTLWLLIPVALIWLVRRTAKARQARTGHGPWWLLPARPPGSFSGFMS